MLQDVHTRKISIPVTAPIGTTVLIAAVPGAWIYVHELIGDLAGAGNLDVLAGVRTLASFVLDAGQGITLQDEPGEDNRPRFECLPGEAFSITVTGGTFNGACHYSLRY
jgi:hypothetical protein